MAIDSSIYSQLKPVDFVGSYQDGLKLRDLADQRKLRQKEQQSKDTEESAYNNSIETGPDGSVSLNQGKFLTELAKGGQGQKAYEYQEKFKQQGIADRKAQIDKIYQEADLIGRTAGSVTDQNSYTAALQSLAQSGVDISQMPKAYDPTLVRTYQMKALTTKEQLQNQIDREKLDIQRREVAAKEKAAGAKSTSGLTVGQKKVDTEFAKDYNQWTSGGAKTARSEINKLQGVINNLKNGNVSTGGMTGLFPDRLTSDRVLAARSDVQSTVMNSLKAILGAQFTEKEGERIIRNTWNEADSTPNNVARLERLVSDLSAQADDKDSKSAQYEQTGTLAGYRASSTNNSNEALKNAARSELENKKKAQRAGIQNGGRGGS